MLSPEELASQLRSRSTNNRVGIFLVANYTNSEVERLAMKFDFHVVDLVELVLAKSRTLSAHLNLSANKFLELIDSVAEALYARTTVVLSDFDVLLAHFGTHDRDMIWAFLRESLRKRRTSLAIIFPEPAHHLFFNSERDQWENARMIANV